MDSICSRKHHRERVGWEVRLCRVAVAFVASREDCLLPGCVPRGLSSAPSELASAQRVRSLSLASRATTNYARARGQVCCGVGFRRDGSGSSSRHQCITPFP